MTGSVGASSLSLPAGGSATSPQSCVNAAYPDFRFFVRSEDPGTVVTASVVVNVADIAISIPVGAATATSSWQPTLPMLSHGALVGLLSGGTGQVALRFASSGGTAQVDDVFIDPSGRCC